MIWGEVGLGPRQVIPETWVPVQTRKLEMFSPQGAPSLLQVPTVLSFSLPHSLLENLLSDLHSH